MSGTGQVIVQPGQANLIHLNCVEQKFQHFLNATVRAGSVYGGCGSYAAGTWSWDAEEEHWIVRRQPRIQFGCVGLGASFLAYWFNYNAESERGWYMSVNKNLHHTFHESAARHDVTLRGTEFTGLRGYREFVAEGEDRELWGSPTHITRAACVGEFINDGWLQFTQRRGGVRYYFKWDPDRFADYNILGIGSHHVYMYIKRGCGGENDPPTDRNRPHQIWRLAADGSTGQPTTWREEEVEVRLCPEPCSAPWSAHAHPDVVSAALRARPDCPPICPGRGGCGHICPLPAAQRCRRSGNRYACSPWHATHGDAALTSIARHPSCDTSQEDVDGWLLRQHVTIPYEVPSRMKRWRQACEALIALWKLRDLRPDGRPPEVGGVNDGLLDYPSRPIRFWRPGRGDSDVAIPRVTAILVQRQENGSWRDLAPEGSLRAGDALRLQIDTTGVADGAALTVSVVDASGDEKIPFTGQVTANRAVIEEELMSFIVPNAPHHQIAFVAWVFDSEISLSTDWIDYVMVA
jgi:hypothetical protein